MAVELKVPSPGESISEVQISRWIKNEGDYVEKDEEVAEIDSDKATLTLTAEAAGALHILVKEGETIPVGSVVASIDTDAKAPAGAPKAEPAKAEAKAASAAAPAAKKAATAKQGYQRRTPANVFFPSPRRRNGERTEERGILAWRDCRFSSPSPFPPSDGGEGEAGRSCDWGRSYRS